MKKIQLLLRYFKYLLSAKGRHATHSPFLFSFVTKVINARRKNEDCTEIEFLRKSLCKSEKEITITDFGAGSSINKATKRKIKDIAHNSAKNAKFGHLLYRICVFFAPN